MLSFLISEHNLYSWCPVRNRVKPKIGCWYQSLLDGQCFEVVALDPHDQGIEIQGIDGEIQEILPGEWASMGVVEIAEEDCYYLLNGASDAGDEEWDGHPLNDEVLGHRGHPNAERGHWDESREEGE